MNGKVGKIQVVGALRYIVESMFPDWLSVTIPRKIGNHTPNDTE